MASRRLQRHGPSVACGLRLGLACWLDGICGLLCLCALSVALLWASLSQLKGRIAQRSDGVPSASRLSRGWVWCFLQTVSMVRSPCLSVFGLPSLPDPSSSHCLTPVTPLASAPSFRLRGSCSSLYRGARFISKTFSGLSFVGSIDLLFSGFTNHSQ